MKQTVKRPKIMVYCTAKEEKMIRAAAKAEKRTLSAFIMLAIQAKFDAMKPIEVSE
jgi:uncharacterized protein (DUF1778 family)